MNKLVFQFCPLWFSLTRRTGASHRMSCPLQFPLPLQRKDAPRRLSTCNSPLQLQTEPESGGGGSCSVYITVTVGNRIHQIKPSIYLCGSSDSAEGQGWPRGERVTLKLGRGGFCPGARQGILGVFFSSFNRATCALRDSTHVR